jgi:hypothetical protein
VVTARGNRCRGIPPREPFTRGEPTSLDTSKAHRELAGRNRLGLQLAVTWTVDLPRCMDGACWRVPISACLLDHGRNQNNDQTSRIRTCLAGLVAWSRFERLTSSQVLSLCDGILERQR